MGAGSSKVDTSPIHRPIECNLVRIDELRTQIEKIEDEIETCELELELDDGDVDATHTIATVEQLHIVKSQLQAKIDEETGQKCSPPVRRTVAVQCTVCKKCVDWRSPLTDIVPCSFCGRACPVCSDMCEDAIDDDNAHHQGTNVTDEELDEMLNEICGLPAANFPPSLMVDELDAMCSKPESPHIRISKVLCEACKFTSQSCRMNTVASFIASIDDETQSKRSCRSIMDGIQSLSAKKCELRNMARRLEAVIDDQQKFSVSDAAFEHACKSDLLRAYKLIGSVNAGEEQRWQSFAVATKEMISSLCTVVLMTKCRNLACSFPSTASLDCGRTPSTPRVNLMLPPILHLLEKHVVNAKHYCELEGRYSDLLEVSYDLYDDMQDIGHLKEQIFWNESPLSGQLPSLIELSPLYSAPVAASAVAQLLVNDKRMRETHFVNSHDRTRLDPGECWYIINRQWLDDWVAFANECGPVPGPIDNSVLLERAGAVKRGLVKGVHYRAICPQVWAFFIATYGGGPIVARRKIDIYDSTPFAPFNLFSINSVHEHLESSSIAAVRLTEAHRTRLLCFSGHAAMFLRFMTNGHDARDQRKCSEFITSAMAGCVAVEAMAMSDMTEALCQGILTQKELQADQVTKKWRRKAKQDFAELVSKAKATQENRSEQQSCWSFLRQKRR